MKFRSGYLHEAHWRGYTYQGTDLEALDARMATQSITAYIGFDATARSLHVGNLVQIMRLRLLQKHGHTPIVLLGDATTRIGDPSGKDQQRQLLSAEQITENLNSIKGVFNKYLTFGTAPGEARMACNGDWLGGLNYIDFLRDYGRHFSLNRMLTFESIKSRLDREQPLSLIEFNYMIFQAYDFLHLFQETGCVLQMGGSDQWGNIVSGTDLIRRVTGQESYGLTVSLITTSDGKKMGKTAEGAVWLNADMKTPYDFWQFWRTTSDADVGRFLRLYTELELAEIEKLEKLAGSEINAAKKILADEATKLCHGAAVLPDIHQAADQAFGRAAPTDASLLPHLSIQAAGGISLVDALVALGFAASKGEARRLIRGGGVRVGPQKVSDEAMVITPGGFQEDGTLRISAGKKRHGLLVISD